MTDKEFKRLSRSQLIDIIYQLQLKQDELTAENDKLSKELTDKRLRVQNAGNIAEAALELHNVMQTAQNAAEHYLEEIQTRVDGEYQRILKETNDQAAAILADARQEADRLIANAKQEADGLSAKANEIVAAAQQEAEEIVAHAKKENPNYDPVFEAILKEFR